MERISHEARNRRQRGAAAVLFVIMLTAIASMLGVIAMRGAVTDLRAAGGLRERESGFYCAEAGLNAARSYFANNYRHWSAMLDPTQSPPQGYPVMADLDGDGAPDFEVTIRDNEDEFAPLEPDPRRDNDLMAVMESRCLNPRMAPRVVREIVVMNVRGTDYRFQAGHGPGHVGNAN